jgi:hypothetical protein
MTRRNAVIVMFSAAVACATGVFIFVALAPCDPNAPVLSDGTREAPGQWAAAWWTLMFASAAFVGAGAGLSERRRRLLAAIGAGIGAR